LHRMLDRPVSEIFSAGIDHYDIIAAARLCASGAEPAGRYQGERREYPSPARLGARESFRRR
jgi:hypothetical protein